MPIVKTPFHEVISDSITLIVPNRLSDHIFDSKLINIKNISIISVFIAIIIGLYGFYFHNLEKFLNVPSEPYYLDQVVLLRDVAYFRLNKGDSTATILNISAK